MHIQTIFAANLRRFCLEHGTIADISRNTGINRQQLNKYLAANSIPNAITLRKLCAYLDIEEASLFIDELGRRTDKKIALRNSQIPKLFGLSPQKLKRFDFLVPELESGHYFCYFPLENVAGMLVRSLITIRENGAHKEFTRITRLSSMSGSAKTLNGGRHTGVVCANKSAIYFIGTNRYDPFQLSLLALDRADSTGPKFFMGVALTHGFKSQLTSRICMVSAPSNTHPKLLIDDLGMVHETEAKLDLIIMAALHSR
jgi:transcriptional regulator with XRE-family HTH domain